MYASKKSKSSGRKSVSQAVKLGYRTRDSQAGCVLGARKLGRRPKAACGTEGVTVVGSAIRLGAKGGRTTAKRRQLSLFGKGKRAKGKK